MGHEFVCIFLRIVEKVEEGRYASESARPLSHLVAIMNLEVPWQQRFDFPWRRALLLSSYVSAPLFFY